MCSSGHPDRRISRLLIAFWQEIHYLWLKRNNIVVIERENENVIIKVNPALIGMDEIQKVIDYFHILESNAQNQGTQEQADELARESQEGWWKENMHRFII